MLFCRTCRRLNSTSAKAIDKVTETTKRNQWKYELDKEIENGLLIKQFKPRHHPGVVQSKPMNLPNAFIKATEIILEDQDVLPKKDLLERSKKFVKYLVCKKPPMENKELKDHISVLRSKVINRLEQEKPHLLGDKDVIKSQMTNQLKQTVYNWMPVKYDIGQSLCYLIGRSAGEYAVLMRILSEIKSRDPDWKPKSLFDFGSGVGTVTWAVNTIWPKSIMEYFNVDSSADMNDLAELLLKGGRGEKKNPLRGVFYRQFFPSKPVPYDLVVSAYTMMELPSLKSRMDSIQTLWKKTTNYLVVVEEGTYSGYKIINEIRDFILSLGDSHVFSPCPHDSICPKFVANDGKPCNFAVRHYEMPLLDAQKSICVKRFSYVVLKKGPRDGNDSEWPRLINPTLLRHKHVICNLCTSEAKIEQAVFTASKYGKLAYRCARVSDWGDRLPMRIKDNSDNDIIDKPQLETNE